MPGDPRFVALRLSAGLKSALGVTLGASTTAASRIWETKWLGGEPRLSRTGAAPVRERAPSSPARSGGWIQGKSLPLTPSPIRRRLRPTGALSTFGPVGTRPRARRHRALQPLWRGRELVCAWLARSAAWWRCTRAAALGGGWARAAAASAARRPVCERHPARRRGVVVPPGPRSRRATGAESATARAANHGDRLGDVEQSRGGALGPGGAAAALARRGRRAPGRATSWRPRPGWRLRRRRRPRPGWRGPRV